MPRVFIGSVKSGKSIDLTSRPITVLCSQDVRSRIEKGQEHSIVIGSNGSIRNLQMYLINESAGAHPYLLNSASNTDAMLSADGVTEPPHIHVRDEVTDDVTELGTDDHMDLKPGLYELMIKDRKTGYEVGGVMLLVDDEPEATPEEEQAMREGLGYGFEAAAEDAFERFFGDDSLPEPRKDAKRYH